MENQIKKNPVKVFTCGAVKAAIWADSRVVNNTVVEVHSVRIDRSYKDKDSNEWKHTNTFNTEDLPKVSIVAQEAYKFIRLRSPEKNKTDELELDNGPQDGSEAPR
jgi:hypothetical protein